MPIRQILPRKVDVVDEVGRWKIRWTLVDDKPEIILHTPHATNSDLYPAIWSIICILLPMLVSSTTREKSFSAILFKVDYWR